MQLAGPELHVDRSFVNRIVYSVHDFGRCLGLEKQNVEVGGASACVVVLVLVVCRCSRFVWKSIGKFKFGTSMGK